MTWNVVVDTVVFCNAIAASRRAQRRGSNVDNFLEALCRRNVVRIVLDKARGLQSEYDETCGREVVVAALYKLQSLNGLVDRDPTTIPSPAREKLLALGFKGTVDKLVVRLGLTGVAVGQPYICSEDSDFWDPADTDSRGDHGSVVCTVLEQDLQLRLLHQAGLVGMT